ncbi:alpha-mannosidase 2 [Cimex lectularius]|uniref:Alpha-mannosidase n=1 Tax=Cimex lectularius TaxID=79782 RepID=A0A8I6S6F7_CIMLE|nr:alpha-mannosidase 2 [Cimex lectularius]
MAVCLRWGSGRFIALVAVCVITWLTLLYTGRRYDASDMAQGFAGREPKREPADRVVEEGIAEVEEVGARSWFRQNRTPPEGYHPDTCIRVQEATADIATGPNLAQFDFQPYWMKSREYWDAYFEKRYKESREGWPKLPLKVIVVPHSHNDPGWLRTFDNYYHYQTRNILNNMADKLTAFKNMTFIWSEISFMSLWWQSVHPTKKRIVKQLLKEGRLEITTGGWVMTDEANSHVYAMVDQLIHGHQWVKNKLGVTPKTGWSIDPFGHGATMPYLLKESGVSEGAIIQRIHYAWKQWLAYKRAGDFLWRQSWDETGRSDMLVHNQPFDIYSIKHSCGPHPQVCLNFDFRKITGEYTEYSLKAVAIDDENVRQKAELLLEQYGRTGSLFPHNVVLMPIGDDFRYNHEEEWDQQYKNYKRLFDYINMNSKVYNTEIVFGTPIDYFREVKKRTKEFPTLKGDFFVYSDIFSEGRPAYWSGYFTTRPYWKILDRELEADLRSAEILYTLSLNRVRRIGDNATLKIMERDLEKLQTARMTLGLFQHHDAITGTSKSVVMHDYALRLFQAIQEMVSVQGYALQALLTKPHHFPNLPLFTRLILPDSDRESYEKLPVKSTITIENDTPRRVILFNSLAQPRQEVVRIRVKSVHVAVFDSQNLIVPSQINPVWNITTTSQNIGRVGERLEIPTISTVPNVYEIVFVAELNALSITTYFLRTDMEKAASKATVYCKDCIKKGIFPSNSMQQGDIQLENHRMRLLISSNGFLRSIMNKQTGKTTQCSIQFAAYPSAQFHSGAYLFMPDPNSVYREKDILEEHKEYTVIITAGPVSSKLIVMYGSFLLHSVEIYHTNGALSHGVYIENIIDFKMPPKNRETELFMRFVTDVNNGETPEFYTDQNGFQTQKRVKIERIGIEGNYYPITTHAYIQDNEKRLTLLVNHAMGSASWQPGWLEVMLDRRTLYDDSRGMGEGIVDNKKTLSKYWLLLEEDVRDEGYSRPTLLANHLSLGLLYPTNVFFLDIQNQETSTPPRPERYYTSHSFLTEAFPCDVHLMNLRTLQDPLYDHFPTPTALMVIHRLGSACLKTEPALKHCLVTSNDMPLIQGTVFTNTNVEVTRLTLTGLEKIEKVTSLDQIRVKPMELATFNVTFL